MYGDRLKLFVAEDKNRAQAYLKAGRQQDVRVLQERVKLMEQELEELASMEEE